MKSCETETVHITETAGHTVPSGQYPRLNEATLAQQKSGVTEENSSADSVRLSRVFSKGKKHNTGLSVS